MDMEKITKPLLTILSVVFLFSHSVAADEPKRILANNMTEIYNVLPEDAPDISGIFTKGMFYGRIRTNYFYKENKNSSLHDPTGFGLGGSLIYKTAPLYGISGTAGLYTSQNLGLLNDSDAIFGSAGKDTFSRYDRLAEGDWGMTVLAQAYLQYSFSRTDIKVGRQIFESFFAKSNDTKMIPNTFEGYSLVSKDIPGTTFSFAFFTEQKLRDHTSFHDVITYDDGSGSTYSRWNNQDDSAAHKGLSFSNLQASGMDVDNYLVIAGISNKSIKNLILDIWFIGVPDLFHSLMFETNYKIELINGWSLTPGLRFLRQFDDGAGKVGGAALNGSLAGLTGPGNGYRNAGSVKGYLYAVRLVMQKDPFKISTGYSIVTDDADLIAPWRGFPTSGYTRSMGEYNWYADTRSWMIQLSYDFGKAGIIKGLTSTIDYVYTDNDDNKSRLGGLSVTDTSILHCDFRYLLPFISNVEAKVRFKLAEADRLPLSGNDPSYREIRFEMNYLF